MVRMIIVLLLRITNTCLCLSMCMVYGGGMDFNRTIWCRLQQTSLSISHQMCQSSLQGTAISDHRRNDYSTIYRRRAVQDPIYYTIRLRINGQHRTMS